MLRYRRHLAGALLIGAAMLPALPNAFAFAADISSTVVSAVPSIWQLIGTYPSLADCQAAGPGAAAGRRWQCTPSPTVPGAYDLYVWVT